MFDWMMEFPTLDKGALRALKKSFDAGYRQFSRHYGDLIESFFDRCSISWSGSSVC